MSLLFANPPWEKGWEWFDPDGKAGELMDQICQWGLADSRWHLLQDTVYAQRLTFGEESRLLFCLMTYIKLRWRAGIPVDAKAYLRAGVQDFPAPTTHILPRNRQ